MKTKSFKWTDPKSTPAALNQVVHALMTIDDLKLKGGKIMDSLKQAQEKQERLQRTIDQLEKQLQFSEENQEQIQKRIEYLKTEFQLSEAQILEHKSKLLREQISRLQLAAETQTQTGEGKI